MNQTSRTRLNSSSTHLFYELNFQLKFSSFGSWTKFNESFIESSIELFSSWFGSLPTLLTNHETHSLTAVSEGIWHKDVPLKSSIFAWWLLYNRLPTKDDLVICDILPYVSQLCVCGRGNNSTLVSILQYIISLCHLVCNWTGFSSVVSQHISDHFIQFAFSTGGYKVHRSFFQLIWLSCIWVL